MAANSNQIDQSTDDDVDVYDCDDYDAEEETKTTTFESRIESDIKDMVKEIRIKAERKKRTLEEQAAEAGRKATGSKVLSGEEMAAESNVIHPNQMKVAKTFLQKIKTSQPDIFHGIKYFDFFTILPKFRSLGECYKRIADVK
jgi:hypothetical protein